MRLLEQQEALQKVLATAATLPTMQIELHDALGRINAAPIVSDMDMPPFNKSAMDGYACRRSDLGKRLRVTETIAAGKAPQHPLKNQECAKIMTGAALPDGADMVFMKEIAEVDADGWVHCTAPSKDNVCYTGEDIKSGEEIIAPFTLLKSGHIPLLAGAGYATLTVSALPKVSVITTGSELTEPHEVPPPYKIRNSNASQVLAQLKSLGVDARYKGIVADEETGLQQSIRDALQESDVMLLSGGVSVGDFDLVPATLTSLGFKLVVDGTAIQPGKPMVFAHKNNQYVFGLSGNPVSSFIQFELYVKPFLYQLQGHSYQPQRFQLPLAEELSRKKDRRLQFIPAHITPDNKVEALPFHGSAHISALALAHCLIEVPIGTKTLDAGTPVYIHIIQ